MKAVVVHQYGGPDVLKLEEYPDPVAGPGDFTATRLGTLARLLDNRKLIPEVGTVLPLDEARMAHEMLAGAPHKRGKIVLTMHGVQ